MGLEIDGTKNGARIAINPGLGLGAVAGMPVYEKILEGFHQLSFYNPDGSRNRFTMIPMVTQMFEEKGLTPCGKIQTLDGVIVYPLRFFNPFDDATGKLYVKEDTYSIHWYGKI